MWRNMAHEEDEPAKSVGKISGQAKLGRAGFRLRAAAAGSLEPPPSWKALQHSLNAGIRIELKTNGGLFEMMKAIEVRPLGGYGIWLKYFIGVGR